MRALARRDMIRVLTALFDTQARRATRYVAEEFTVKAVRRHKPNARDRRVEVVLTFGEPNYLERQFIKACNKAGEPFPVKKVQLKFWPEKKK